MSFDPAGEGLEQLPGPVRRLMAFVLRNPGCSIHRACIGLGMPRARLLHHLTSLERQGAVIEVGAPPRMMLVANIDGIQDHPEQLRALTDPGVRQVYEWLRTDGPARAQKVIERAGETHGWPRATVQWRLSLLVKAGLAERRLDRRLQTWLRPLPMAPSVERALQSAQTRLEQEAPEGYA